LILKQYPNQKVRLLLNFSQSKENQGLMKKLIYFLLSISLFLSCKQKEEIAPVLPTLKGFTVESSLPNLTAKTDYTLTYTNDKLSNLQKTDVIEKDGVLKTYPTVNNVITYGTYDTYKIVSGTDNSSTSKMIYNAEKFNGEFNITIYSDKNFQTLFYMERNTNDKVSKYELVKPIVIGSNGIVSPILPNTYIRYEYDANGNAVKVFQKIDGFTNEFLTNEYTYDANPNPNKALVWIFRLVGYGAVLASSESNNNILTAKNYSQGTLISETITVYTYDANTKLPLAAITSGKSYNPNTTIGSSKTAYKY
jgi:hypothetical protein